MLVIPAVGMETMLTSICGLLVELSRLVTLLVYLGEQQRVLCPQNCLLSSYDAFRVMFDGGYRERDAKDIEIPNIPWDVFELMMRYIYTGSVDVNMDVAQDLLRAADQYLLKGLKHLCEYAIAQVSAGDLSVLGEDLCQVSPDNFLSSVGYLSTKMYSQLIQRLIPETRAYFVRVLSRPIQADL
uniref:Armadillo/beta-catenin repeat family protein / BTB/POZ domain-containing protein n=1 Tax=Solanum tuberosum TaxID=4113 RepID=M1BSC4_SOLTU